jgi:hypothetical protein
MNGYDPMLDDNYQDALKDARAELALQDNLGGAEGKVL